MTYIDDSEERAEAISFFEDALSPLLQLPEEIDEMSESDAQEYLDTHPIHEQWGMLKLTERIDFEVEDLRRLEFLPDLQALHSHVDHLTDEGVSLITQISGLKRLLVYSPLVTDGCLKYMERLKNLTTIDLQGSHQITRKAFDELVVKLPNLVDIYPPFHRPLREIMEEIQKDHPL
ncbi:MAG: hypothetical protein AAGA25_09625 [Planctomycetota bacterium]